MANPALSRTFGGGGTTAGLDAAAASVAPLDGTGTMTIGGTARATSVLMALLVGAGVWGWTTAATGGWLIAALLVAVAVAIVTIVKPEWARITAPIYAIAEGVVLGAISRLYETAFDGIVVQAILATVVVLGVMLVLYATRTIKVTDRVRSLVIAATLGIAVFYLISLVLALFGVGIPLVWDSGWLGIGFSVFVIAVAAFNLLLDFDLIERGARMGAPASMEWYAAFGLLLTLVWLYLEILRLLAKLQNR